MAMTCRRCDEPIEAGGIANIIRSLVVGECCRRPDEKGYRDDAGLPMPLRGLPSRPVDPNGPEPLGVTRRRVEILQLAEEGLVTRQGNQVNAFDQQAGVMRDSKSVAKALRDHNLVYWEKLPLQGFYRESPRWVLRLTVEGVEWLKLAEMEAMGANAG